MKCLQSKQKNISNKIIEVKVNGDCMSPEINNGDVVNIYKYYSLPKVGDVVLLLDENNCFRLHRIVKISNDKYYIKGDNSYFFDNVVGIETIVGFYKLGSEYKNNNLIMLLTKLSYLVGELSTITRDTKDEFYVTIADNILKQIIIIKRKIKEYEYK